MGFSLEHFNNRTASFCYGVILHGYEITHTLEVSERFSLELFKTLNDRATGPGFIKKSCHTHDEVTHTLGMITEFNLFFNDRALGTSVCQGVTSH